MTPVLALVLVWVVGAVLVGLDGRRPLAIALAVTTAAVVFALDAVLLVQHARGAPVWEQVTGGWPRGIGIRLRADRLSLLFATLISGVLLAVLVQEARAGVHSRLFPGLVLLLGAGLHGAFFTGDLFNFYVFFELSIVSSFALAAYGYGKAEIRATFVYVAVNLLGSVFFLTGVAVVYHEHGTLDLAQLAVAGAAEGAQPGTIAGALIFSSLALKLGLFPFHGWVPVLYGHARPSVASAMSGALVNLAAYGLLRIGYTVLRGAREEAAVLLVALGATAAVYGTLIALRRRRPEEVAAYAAIAHAGYVVLAIGVAGEVGVLAALLIVLSGSLDKATMFLALESGPAVRGVTALVAGASAAGLPITAGFFAKVQLFRAAVDAPAAWATAGALTLASLLALAVALRFLRLARRREQAPRVLGLAPLALAAASVAMGLWPEPWARLGAEIARELSGGAP